MLRRDALVREEPGSREGKLCGACEVAVVYGLRLVGHLVIVLHKSAAVIDRWDLVGAETAIVAVEVGVVIELDVHAAQLERALADSIHF